jgi:uncharacterized linocin/CFP29 family protein
MNEVDFMLNGEAHGSVAERLLACNFDVNCLRPYIGPDGRHYMTQNVNGVLQAVPVQNANATLRKDEWIWLDSVIIKAAQERLKFVADIRSRGLVLSIPNGMGTTVLQTQTMSDINDASMSMDGLREGDNDRPVYGIENLPLPIIHKDFQFSSRQIATSRNGGVPIDVSMAEMAGRKVAEMAEKLAIGVSTFPTYGGGTIPGLTTFASRITKVLTAPTDSAWTPETFLHEVIAMRKLATAAKHYGPYVLYLSANWDEYLDRDFKANGSKTLRERVQELSGVTDVMALDYLTNYDAVLLQTTSDVVREVVGMDIVTVQWQTHGGLLLHFKVMAILVPQFRADHNGNTGIVHGSV